MDLEVYRIYLGKAFPKESIKVKYDKLGKKRPAWIYIGGLPKSTFIISTRIDNKTNLYRKYISLDLPLFIPVNYTKQEMRRFYDKFSETYDKHIKSYNISAAKFLLSKLNLSKNAKILDLGAGTGLGSIPFVRKGYKNLTLLEYSPKMLAKAKKKKELKVCRFICEDIRELNLKEKFDLIISVFSLGLCAYFKEDEMYDLWKVIFKHLKPGGILALMGHEYSVPQNLFKEVKKGKRKIIKGYSANWYVGKKLSF